MAGWRSEVVPNGYLNLVLGTLALASNDAIQVKMPNGLAGFLACNDSLVVHFKDAENAGKIRDIIDEWLAESGLRKGEREMGRTELAADSGGAVSPTLLPKRSARGFRTMQTGIPPQSLRERRFGTRSSFHRCRRMCTGESALLVCH